jgi:hypothetical protein
VKGVLLLFVGGILIWMVKVESWCSRMAKRSGGGGDFSKTSFSSDLFHFNTHPNPTRAIKWLIERNCPPYTLLLLKM